MAEPAKNGPVVSGAFVAVEPTPGDPRVSQADRTLEQPAIFDEVDDRDTDVVDVPPDVRAAGAQRGEPKPVMVVPRSPMPREIPPPPRVPTFSAYEEELAELGPPSIAPVSLSTSTPTDSFTPATSTAAGPLVSQAPPTTSATYTRAPDSRTDALPLKRKVVVGGTFAIGFFILAAAGLRALVVAEDPRAAAAAFDVAERASVLPPLPTPSPTTGVVALAQRADPEHPLVVDGVRVDVGAIEVACGKHTVKVASEPAREIDVPCAATVLVHRSGGPAHGTAPGLSAGVPSKTQASSTR